MTEIQSRNAALRKKCPYSELFWSAFSLIWTDKKRYGENGQCGSENDWGLSVEKESAVNILSVDIFSGIAGYLKTEKMKFRKDLEKYLPPSGSDPLIIWWHDHLYPHRANERLTCEMGTCTLSSDHSKFSDPSTRAIVFSGTHFEAGDLPLPRKPYHEWAIFHGESPKNNWMLSTGIGMRYICICGLRFYGKRHSQLHHFSSLIFQFPSPMLQFYLVFWYLMLWNLFFLLQRINNSVQWASKHFGNVCVFLFLFLFFFFFFFFGMEFRTHVYYNSGGIW